MAERIQTSVPTQNGYANVSVDGTSVKVDLYEEGLVFVHEDAGPPALLTDMVKTDSVALDTTCSFSTRVDLSRSGPAIAAVREAQRQSSGTTAARLAQVVSALDRCAK